MSTSAKSIATPQEKRTVTLLAASQALFLITAVTVMTLSGVVGQALTPSPSLATLPVALMMVGTVVATLPASLLMKRIGRRKGFLIGTAAGGVAGGLLATLGVLAESFLLFCLGNLLLGVYQAFAMYYRFAAADAASDAFRSRAISLVLAGGVVAAFLGPWNASYSQSLPLPTPEAGPFAVLTLLAVVAPLLVAMLRIPAAPSDHQARETARPLQTIAAQPRFLVAVLCAAVGYAVMILVMTSTPLAMRSTGFEMQQAATVMQWHVLGMFAPSFITGTLIARLGLLNLLIAGVVVLFTAVAVALAGQGFWHFWVALVLLGIGWNFMFVGGSTLLTHTHTPAEKGKVQGVNDLVVFGLVAAGSLMAGSLLHQVGWAGLNIVLLPFLAIALLAVLWLRFAPQSTPGRLNRPIHETPSRPRRGR